LTENEVLENIATALYPTGALYLPTYITLIVFFNYYYTFLQLDPKDVSDQLRKQARQRLMTHSARELPRSRAGFNGRLGPCRNRLAVILTRRSASCDLREPPSPTFALENPPRSSSPRRLGSLIS